MNHNEIALEGSPNFRDLGGYTTDNGQTVRYGKVFRSGHRRQGPDRNRRLEQYIRDHLGVSNEMQASLRSTLLEPATA